MIQLIRNRNRLMLIAGDILAVLLANVLAVALRFEFNWKAMNSPGNPNLELLITDLFLTPVVFAFAGLYQGYWKYAGLNDLLRIGRAVAFRTVGLIVIFYGLNVSGLSRAVMIISTVLLLGLCGLVRLVPRFQLELLTAKRRAGGRRTLIFGAGDTGESLLRELRQSPQLEFNPIGFIDDEEDKRGIMIHGVPVLGTRQEMEWLIEAYGVREAIIAVPGASGRDMREIFEICRRQGVRFRRVPTRGELERGAARVSQIRAVDLEDLLGRDVVGLDQHLLHNGLIRRRVLVTGAAGSVGREMARQIATYEPEELILLDRNENNLFDLEAELAELHPLGRFRFVIADVQDRRRLDALFVEARPEIVFHAAAYKHVPFMERHPLEAIRNNVMATWSLVEAASAHGVDRFIYISTDKAVRPTSVMGATKRLGERLILSLTDSSTRFMAVRFGNVLGSDGSVIPTFRKQISAGGPVTVTHAEATRYFMTIAEAVQLVLMAGVSGQGGELFLLRMGEPVRIIDMARSMIELSGLGPDEEVKIVVTGLRPGEKLHEELKGEGEEALPTSNEKIMILTGIEPLSEEEWAQLDGLGEATREGRWESALTLLKSLVKDYSSMGIPPAVLVIPPHKVVGIDSRKRKDSST